MKLNLTLATICAVLAAAPSQSPYAPWKNGPPTDPDWFPIGVWLQSPRNAAKYKALGINLYVGQWKGPTKQQLETLTKARMPLIGSQTVAALRPGTEASTTV